MKTTKLVRSVLGVAVLGAFSMTLGGCDKQESHAKSTTKTTTETPAGTTTTTDTHERKVETDPK